MGDGAGLSPRGENMSLNEFVLAFSGVIIGLGVADLLTSLHRLLRAGRRVRWDWLTLVYAGYMLFGLIIFWWWQFGYPPKGQALTILQFLPNLFFLALGFLMVASALPDDVPASGIDLRAFYAETITHRWGLLAASLACNLITLIWGAIAAGQPQWLPILIVSGALAAAGAALLWRSRWVHACSLLLLFFASGFSNLFDSIGP